MLYDFLLADAKRPLLPFPVLSDGLQILFRGDSKHGTQRGHRLLIRNLGVASDAFAVFHAPGGLQNHTLARLHPQLSRIEIILLASAFKADTDNNSHVAPPSRKVPVRAPPAIVRRRPPPAIRPDAPDQG
ncbi:hypothetical protein SDC9_174120 [bioreactor metagenome]|uniref:Uncharacterized protein n=1 Tax=bioreactor metagenome TaxID=1076179 RepID=A0A645GJ10_9ZZZZ